MKYSFFSSVCAWFPSALMMAVSASGASSAPLASLVRYVPVVANEEAAGSVSEHRKQSLSVYLPVHLFIYVSVYLV